AAAAEAPTTSNFERPPDGGVPSAADVASPAAPASSAPPKVLPTVAARPVIVRVKRPLSPKALSRRAVSLTLAASPACSSAGSAAGLLLPLSSVGALRSGPVAAASGRVADIFGMMRATLPGLAALPASFDAGASAAGLGLNAASPASRWCFTDASIARRARPGETGFNRKRYTWPRLRSEE